MTLNKKSQRKINLWPPANYVYRIRTNIQRFTLDIPVGSFQDNFQLSTLLINDCGCFGKL
ncbi:CLUMA_CG000570, isoform A [Clunio marinus]|uniref:CLUMA_CG000570, isoform A n=1 Tax=Clunio marinus TaxID=568069 RepID=A0A1J1HKG8_9DIPT|nr:CLUMA_CG000570, isoform A [Clunio marinus]